MTRKVWCASCPRVSVPTRDLPKPITLVMPYYENAKFFRRQLANWQEYDADVKRRVSGIIVDDGSPSPAELPDDPPFHLRLFRITVDVRWNWLAARNIGLHYAAQGWVLMTDMDHVVPAETMRALVYGQHDPDVVYAFARIEHTGIAIAPHSASFLLTRELFWRIGGYDETLSGHYGTDGEFRRRIAQHAPTHLLPQQLVRHEYVEDASTTRYKRKQPEDAAVKQLIAQRGKHWRPKVLSFPYHEVTPCHAS